MIHSNIKIYCTRRALLSTDLNGDKSAGYITKSMIITRHSIKTVIRIQRMK